MQLVRAISECHKLIHNQVTYNNYYIHKRSFQQFLNVWRLTAAVSCRNIKDETKFNYLVRQSFVNALTLPPFRINRPSRSIRWRTAAGRGNRTRNPILSCHQHALLAYPVLMPFIQFLDDMIECCIYKKNKVIIQQNIAQHFTLRTPGQCMYNHSICIRAAIRFL